jgi:hypothetical protein
LLTYDHELAWRHPGVATPSPDELRRVAAITDLAASLGLNNETVRRRVRHYREMGWVKRLTGGYLVAMERRQHLDVLAPGPVLSQRFLQPVQALRQLGVDPTDPRPERGGQSA